MKAILIDPADRSLAVVDVGGREDIARLIGFDTIESDAVGTGGDRLHFDEECFLRGTGGRFQVDSLVPISGRAVVTGASAMARRCATWPPTWKACAAGSSTFDAAFRAIDAAGVHAHRARGLPRGRLPVQPRTLPMSKAGIFTTERSQPPAAAVDILLAAGAA